VFKLGYINLRWTLVLYFLIKFVRSHGNYCLSGCDARTWKQQSSGLRFETPVTDYQTTRRHIPGFLAATAVRTLDSTVKTQFLVTPATQQAANLHAENDVASPPIVAFTSHLRTREVAGMLTLGMLSSAVTKYTQPQPYG